MDDGWKRVGARARQRREDLGLTQEAVAHAAGVATSTIRLIETARQSRYQPTTLRSVSIALDWPPGAIDAIRKGGEPEDAAAPRDSLIGGRERTVEERLADLEAQMREILRALSQRASDHSAGRG
jgi:transcriptional regulator with XRE-family HTH domain